MPTTATPAAADREVRENEYGNKIAVGDIRSFLRAALGHDTTVDALNELIFDHVVWDRMHPSVVASSLPSIINEILETATFEDWQALADELISEGRELTGEGT